MKDSMTELPRSVHPGGQSLRRPSLLLGGRLLMAVMALHRSPSVSLMLLQPSLQLIGLRLAVADRRELDIVFEVLRISLFMTIDANALRRS